MIIIIIHVLIVLLQFVGVLDKVTIYFHTLIRVFEVSLFNIMFLDMGGRKGILYQMKLQHIGEIIPGSHSGAEGSSGMLRCVCR